MLDRVDVGVTDLSAYEGLIAQDLALEIGALAGRLKGARLAHINATPYGGGVSELLRSLVPLYRGLGINADWLVISGDSPFFTVTKSMHNALQGSRQDLPENAHETYLDNNKRNAGLLDEEYDFYVIHDPQPLALRRFKPDHGGKWVWRCHIDTSEPNEDVLAFLSPFIADYDALVFTMAQFVPPNLRHSRIAFIAPAIDPLSPKNVEMPVELCRSLTEWLGVNPQQPLMAQISRFDPWKDPLGVVEAYRLARREVPDLQLALLGSMALDDPEGWDTYKELVEATRHDEGVHVRTNLVGVNDTEVNALQRRSQVVIQKSIREGFGLVVSESLWKETPVVANRAGGIPLQLEDGVGGFLVDTTDEAAERIIYLFNNLEEAGRMGRAGRERVKRSFLMPRLLADEMRLLAGL